MLLLAILLLPQDFNFLNGIRLIFAESLTTIFYRSTSYLFSGMGSSIWVLRINEEKGAI